MNPEDELATLRLRVRQLEAELKLEQEKLALAESFVKVARHGRDELSIDLIRTRKRYLNLSILISPLTLLLKQLEANPNNSQAWSEAHQVAERVTNELTGTTEVVSPAPEPADVAPYPRTPSAMLPQPRPRDPTPKKD